MHIQRGLLRLLSLLAVFASDAEAGLRPLHDTARGLRVAGEDFWLAATAPVRMESTDWFDLLEVMAIAGVLFALDDEIDRAAQRNLDAPLVEQTTELGASLDRFGLMGKTWPLYAGTLFVGYVSGVDRMTRIGAEILEAQWMGGALRNGFKLALGRRRPNEDRGSSWFEFNGGTSLPSGHTATVFAAAEVLRLHAARWWVSVPLYAAAVSVGVERVTSRQHWASDVWIGAISGIAAARFVVRRHQPGADGPEWTFVPALAPGGEGAWAIRRGF